MLGPSSEVPRGLPWPGRSTLPAPRSEKSDRRFGNASTCGVNNFHRRSHAVLPRQYLPPCHHLQQQLTGGVPAKAGTAPCDLRPGEIFWGEHKQLAVLGTRLGSIKPSPCQHTNPTRLATQDVHELLFAAFYQRTNPGVGRRQTSPSHENARKWMVPRPRIHGQPNPTTSIL